MLLKEQLTLSVRPFKKRVILFSFFTDFHFKISYKKYFFISITSVITVHSILPADLAFSTGVGPVLLNQIKIFGKDTVTK